MECEPCDEEDGSRFEVWPEYDSGLIADGERQELRSIAEGKRWVGRAVECRLLIVTTRWHGRCEARGDGRDWRER
eukprot:7120270-Prymnesium_polylepis.1